MEKEGGREMEKEGRKGRGCNTIDHTGAPSPKHLSAIIYQRLQFSMANSRTIK